MMKYTVTGFCPDQGEVCKHYIVSADSDSAVERFKSAHPNAMKVMCGGGVARNSVARHPGVGETNAHLAAGQG